MQLGFRDCPVDISGAMGVHGHVVRSVSTAPCDATTSWYAPWGVGPFATSSATALTTSSAAAFAATALSFIAASASVTSTGTATAAVSRRRRVVLLAVSRGLER